jgi:signal transduction histidine kinase
MKVLGESPVRLEALLREQAALRRVATLVAQDAEPARIFASVCEEVGCVLGVTTTNLVRFEDDGTATVVGAWGAAGAPMMPLATVPLPLDGETVAPRIRRSGRTVRVDDYTGLGDALALRLLAVGIRTAVGAPIVVAGRLWGAVIAADAEPYNLPADAESRISSFAQLITDALANTDAREQLAASRARILEAGDEERRRLGRDLHDGAQQRLVGAIISLQLAQKRWERDPERAREHVDDALGDAQAAIGELRELAAGIHPSVLTDRGLAAALETLASRSPVPVELDADLDGRLPLPVETTAYFVVAEALTNVGKYARASRASVGVRVAGEQLEIEVLDDGVGGADASAGTGLLGLADRVSALRGTFEVTSPPGRGTRVHARISLNGVARSDSVAP